MAAGFSSTMRYLGGIAGVAVLGRLLHLSGSRTVVLDAHHTVLTVFLVVLGVTLLCPIALGPLARRRPVEPATAAAAPPA
jgi:hypothetical protein